jgi:hypothetical protein
LAVALVALPVLYAFQLATDSLPLPVALAESAAVVALYFACEGGLSRAAIAAVGCVSFAMIVMSLATPTHGDPWAYVGYAILPHFADAYHPPSTAFGGDFARINRFIGTPMVPCVYGPFWLAYDRLLVQWVPTLAVGVTVIKVAAAAILLGVLALLRRLEAPAALVAAAAVNPALMRDGVWGAHNAFLALLLCLAAMLALGARRSALAVVLVAAAILVQITFVVVGLVVFGYRTARFRGLAFTAALAIAAAAIALVGWHDLLRAMMLVAGKATNDPGRFLYLHVFTALLAIVLAALAFARGRVFPMLAWTFASLSAAVYSWYLACSVPYVAGARGREAIVLFAVWPLMLALNDGRGRPLTPFALFLALLALAALGALRTLRVKAAVPSAEAVTAT